MIVFDYTSDDVYEELNSLITPTVRKRVEAYFLEWFEKTKKNIVDYSPEELQERSATFKRELAWLAEDFKLIGANGAVRIDTSSRSADVLKQLRFGTRWFNGMSELENNILNVISGP